MLASEVALLGKLRGWQSRAERAKETIRAALALDARWSISFSGGKDSTVLLDLALAIDPNLPVIWFDDGWDYPETLWFLERTEERIGRKIVRVSVPVSGKFWRGEVDYRMDDPAYRHECDLSYAEWKNEYTGALIGMRKEESSRRDVVLRTRGETYYHKSLGHWHCCPLASWSTADIWGYIGGMGLAYNPVYDRLRGWGVGLEQMRVGPLTAWMVYQYGALATLRRGWPELYARFVAMYPELRSYT